MKIKRKHLLLVMFLLAAAGLTLLKIPVASSQGVTLVSVNGNLECFKQGSEPQARLGAGEYDELDRAVARPGWSSPA